MIQKKGVRYSHGFPVGRRARSTERSRCEVCDSVILQPHQQGRRRSTCSDKCRARLRRLRLRVETSRKEKMAEIRKTVKELTVSVVQNSTETVDSRNHIN